MPDPVNDNGILAHVTVAQLIKAIEQRVLATPARLQPLMRDMVRVRLEKTLTRSAVGSEPPCNHSPHALPAAGPGRACVAIEPPIAMPARPFSLSNWRSRP